MPGFFDALQQQQPIESKQHFVTVDGVEYEVSLEKKLEILQSGEEFYEFKDGSLVQKIIEPSKVRYPELIKDTHGHDFYNCDPFWPKDIVEGGYTWQTL